MNRTWIQIWYGEFPGEPYNDCMRIVKGIAYEHNDKYMFIHHKPNIEPEKAAILKDQMIIGMALDGCHDDCIFIDCDCYPLCYPEFAQDLPYFGNTYGYPDVFYIGVNGCAKFFHDLAHEFVDRNIGMYYGCWRRVLYNKRVGLIKPDDYVHFYQQKEKGRYYDKCTLLPWFKVGTPDLLCTAFAIFTISTLIW